MRDRALGSTIRLKFTTTNANGAPVAPSSAFVPADFRIYKDGSASEKATTNGITVTSPFDGVAGRHMIEIDTSNSTGDAGFWSAGSAYFVELNTAKTVNSQSVSGLEIGSFSLELQTADVRRFGGIAGTFASGRPEVRVTSIADNTLTAAAIAASALNDKGNWAKAGDAMTLDGATLTALFADVDTGALVASIVAQFDQATDLPVDTIAALAASRTVTALASLISDAAAAKAAAQSADTKLTSGRLSRVDRLPDVIPGTTGGLALHGATGGGGAGDAEQATLLEVQEAVDSIAVALAGGSPVEPTGTTVFEQLNLIQSNTSSLSNLTASLPLSPGVIVGPSEPLVIGDDYTSAVGRQVRVNLLSSTGGSATTTFGSKSLSDAGTSIQLLLRKSGQVSAAAQLVGTCSFFPAETVDGVEIPPYLLVSFSRAETAKATPGAYDMQAEAVWGSGEVVTFAPYGQVEFVRNIQRVG